MIDYKKTVLRVTVFILALIIGDSTISIVSEYNTKKNALYDYVKAAIGYQQTMFEDEIYSIKEKALAYRVERIVIETAKQSENAGVCITMHSFFNNQNYKTSYCQNLEKDINSPKSYDFWLGNDRAAIFLVSVDTELKFYNLINTDNIISILFNLSILGLLLLSLHKVPLKINVAAQPWQSNKKKIQINEIDEIDYRFYVDLLNDAVNLWIDMQQSDKITLANECGLWTVTIDKGTLRTATLDKYLDENKIPKNPRIQNMIDTVLFVLKNTEGTNEAKESIKDRIEFAQKRVSLK